MSHKHAHLMRSIFQDPPSARYFDEHVKNGFGVMADDLVAAGYTLLCLALLKLLLA